MSEISSILLIGMRGAGKTTLGALVASHLGLPFIDADDLFCSTHPGHTPPTFVKEFGWPAFRASETEILEGILAGIAEGERKVVSLGGGVVEEERNRELLKKFWGGSSLSPIVGRDRGIVIHVFREIDQVFAEPTKEGGRRAPQWKVGGQEEVWARRRPWFRECSSHEFVNFTNQTLTLSNEGADVETKEAAHRMHFEQVERDFIRFFRRILGPYNKQQQDQRPFLDQKSTKRTYLVTLPFPDITPYVPSLPLLCTGASAIELRADHLSDPHPHPRPGVAEAYENPSLSYISEQHALLRRHAPDLPIVFTLRTPAQGGKYPYPSGASEEALFASLHHALKLGTDVIDIEQGLDPVRTARVVADAKERQATVIISWRDVVGPASGGFTWNGPEAAEKYSSAVALGADIVKIVGTASDVQDNFLLRVFAFSDLVKNGPLLSAYNMGPYGRMSRFLNPLLASVTHPVARKGTQRGVIGAPSMTFCEVQQALHLSGLLPHRNFITFALSDELSRIHNVRVFCEQGFRELGLPYETFDLESTSAGLPAMAKSFKHALEFCLDEPFFSGGFIERAAGEEALASMDEVGELARSIGGVDAFVVQQEGSQRRVIGDHIYTRALLRVLGERLSPSNAISPDSFAVVLSPSFADLSITATSPLSISSRLPSSNQDNSLLVRSTLLAFSQLGIRQVAVVDPSLEPIKPLASRRPTIVATIGDTSSLVGINVEDLLSSPTGGVVVNFEPRGPRSPSSPIIDSARSPSRSRKGWIIVTAEQLDEEFSRELFKFWTGVAIPPLQEELPADFVED
ncbi:aldolase [Meredithblackwellia eburnea MCA 4105]